MFWKITMTIIGSLVVAVIIQFFAAIGLLYIMNAFPEYANSDPTLPWVLFGLFCMFMTIGFPILMVVKVYKADPNKIPHYEVIETDISHG